MPHTKVDASLSGSCLVENRGHVLDIAHNEANALATLHNSMVSSFFYFAWFDFLNFPTWFKLTVPTWFDSLFLPWFDPFSRLNSSYGLQLDSTHFFRFIWLKFNAFMYIYITLFQYIVPSHSVFRESQMGQGVFKIIQHWNYGIIHNSENLGHSKPPKIQRSFSNSDNNAVIYCTYLLPTNKE